MYFDKMIDAFGDELQKIAGIPRALQGNLYGKFTTPRAAQYAQHRASAHIYGKPLVRSAEQPAEAAKFLMDGSASRNRSRRILGAVEKNAGVKKWIAPVVGGAVGWEVLRRANKDRKIGRQVRMQQQQGY